MTNTTPERAPKPSARDLLWDARARLREFISLRELHPETPVGTMVVEDAEILIAQIKKLKALPEEESLRTQLVTKDEEIGLLKQDRDEWRAIAERTDAKMLHEQADHNKTVDRLLALRAENARLAGDVGLLKEFYIAGRDMNDTVARFIEGLDAKRIAVFEQRLHATNARRS